MRRETTLRRREFIGFGGAAVFAPKVALAATPGSPFAELEARSGGPLGVYAEELKTGRALTHRADERFPLCSSFKCLAAGAVLARVDRGEDRLDRFIKYGLSDLMSYAPTAKAHVNEGGLALGALCEAAVSLSDNTAANLILDAIDGPAGLTRWLREIGDPVTRLDHKEPELNRVPVGAETDTTSPRAMAASVRKLLLGEVLKPESRARLLAWMEGCKTGDHRIRAGAPGWRVADKTGTYDVCCNDVAYLRDATGRQVMLALYLKTATRLDDAGREAVLAEATRIALRALSNAHG
jgi:beta-lactamase class A